MVQGGREVGEVEVELLWEGGLFWSPSGGWFSYSYDHKTGELRVGETGEVGEVDMVDTPMRCPRCLGTGLVGPDEEGNEWECEACEGDGFVESEDDDE